MIRTKILILAGESGSADTVRDPRGFSIKMYTDEGLWDMVGNNTPIFFVRDPFLVCIEKIQPNLSKTNSFSSSFKCLFILKNAIQKLI